VEPRKGHWIDGKDILRYIRRTITYGLRCVSNNDVQLLGFTDSDWTVSENDRKSTSRLCFSFGIYYDIMV
jgi:hypothetical protein